MFTDKRFSDVKDGMSEENLVQILGKPLDISTHVVFPRNGGSNNYPGRIEPTALPAGAYIRHYTLCYSRAEAKDQNFEVCNVFVGTNGKVVGKDRYFTD